MGKVVLSYGDNPYTSTGYGQVWGNLLPRWVKEKPDWKFYHVGWQSRDRPHETKEGYFMLPMINMQYGYDTVTKYLLQYNPDFLITLCDVGWQSGYIKPIMEARKNGWRGKWIAYTPIDTHSWAMTWDEVFEIPDINVAMSEFGEKSMKEHNVPNVKMIPHGVDNKVFFPLKNKEELKKKYEIEGKFVVGFVGRNQRRKMIDVLMNGFSQFSKGKDDVVLLMHTDMKPPEHGWDLSYLQWKYEKLNDPDFIDKKKFVLTKTDLNVNLRQMIQPESMNNIYNLMDVFGYLTGGEGFGLPAIECQSAGVPLLMSECTTAFDLCKKENRVPLLRDTYQRVVTEVGTNGVEFYKADDKKFVELLEKKYKKWKEKGLSDESKSAREFALKYDWDKISKKWISLFENEE